MIAKEELYELIVSPKKLNSERMEGLNEVIDKYPFFQAGWLLFLKNLKNVESKEYQTILKKGALHVPDRRQLYIFLNKESVSKANKNLGRKVHHNPLEYNLGVDGVEEHGDSLIDKFLSSGPSPIRIKNEISGDTVDTFGNEIIEQSIHEDNEIITETLAMIYFDQKKYDKALEAFKKLSLKYPEKSIYFATRIAEIEQLKNI